MQIPCHIVLFQYTYKSYIYNYIYIYIYIIVRILALKFLPNSCTFKFMPSSIFHKHVNVLSLVTAFSLYYKIIMQAFIKADRH